jgi:hypothetical protein
MARNVEESGLAPGRLGSRHRPERPIGEPGGPRETAVQDGVQDHKIQPQRVPGLRVCCLGAVDMYVEGLWNNLWITRLTVSTNSHGEVVIRSSTETPSQGVRASPQHHNLSGPL